MRAAYISYVRMPTKAKRKDNRTIIRGVFFLALLVTLGDVADAQSAWYGIASATFEWTPTNYFLGGEEVELLSGPGVGLAGGRAWESGIAAELSLSGSLRDWRRTAQNCGDHCYVSDLASYFVQLEGTFLYRFVRGRRTSAFALAGTGLQARFGETLACIALAGVVCDTEFIQSSGSGTPTVHFGAGVERQRARLTLMNRIVQRPGHAEPTTTVRSWSVGVGVRW